MEFLGLANGENENLALNLLIRDLRSVARSFLYSGGTLSRLFFFFFWLHRACHPRRAARRGGFCASLVLSFFFQHIRARYKRRNTHGEIPNQSRFSTFDVETCQNYMEWCMKIASIQILWRLNVKTFLFQKKAFQTFHLNSLRPIALPSWKIQKQTLSNKTESVWRHARTTSREKGKKEARPRSFPRITMHRNGRKPREQWRMRVIMPAACVRLHGN